MKNSLGSSYFLVSLDKLVTSLFYAMTSFMKQMNCFEERLLNDFSQYRMTMVRRICYPIKVELEESLFFLVRLSSRVWKEGFA